MKARHSESYYRDQWDRMIDKYGRYWNPESDLEHEMRCYRDTELPEKALGLIEQMMAKKIYDICKADMMEEMKKIKRLESGDACLGYTSHIQEVSAMHDLIERFEFTCFQLSVFKKNHNIA